MSSFLDRWIYGHRNSFYNESTRHANTGAQYTKTSTMGSSPHGSPSNYLSAHAADEASHNLEGKTTPNLRNVPWAYYDKDELARTRRGSASSDKSSENETE